jgi:hypothetical protein
MKAKDHVLNLLSHGFKFDTVARLNESQVRVLSEKIFKEKTKEVKIKDSKLKNEIKDFIKTHSKIKDIDKNINDWTDEKLVNQIKGYAERAGHGEANKKAHELFKKLEKDSKGKKEETKEQAPPNTTVIQKPQTASYQVNDNSKTMINGVEVDTTGGKTVVTPLTEIGEDEDTVNVVNDPDATEDGMGIFEKFESKSQQRLFYARCGNGKTKTEKKWCKWAKEFSKDTNYETTPEKKEKNESDEKFIEESIVRLIEKNISPRMSKGDLIRTINEKSQESSMILKNPLKNTMFSDESGIEMKRMKKPTTGLPVMGTMEENTKEKEAPVKEPGIKTPPKRKGNPFKNPNPGTKEKPRGQKKEMDENTREKEAPVKEPGIKTPPKRRDNPFKNPNPGTKEKPRGERKTKDEVKKDFIGLIKQALTK